MKTRMDVHTVGNWREPKAGVVVGFVTATFLAALAAGPVILLDASPASAATGYVVTDLGTLSDGAQDTTATGINSGGWVVGTSANRPFLWKDGVLSDLGTLPGGTWGEATDINDSNQIVGQSYGPTPDCGNCAHGFVFDVDEQGNVFRRLDLGTREGGSASWATAISNSGFVAGYGVVPYVNIRAMLWTATGAQLHVDDIPECGPCNSVFEAVSASGHAVGTSGYRGAFYWNGSTDEQIAGSSNSWAYDINDRDQVAGTVDLPTGGRRAFVWAPGSKVVELGLLATGTWSEGRAINSNGDVVGTASVAGGNGNHAFLFRGGTMTDLNDLLPLDSGWTLEAALDVNDRGQIVGYGSHNGRRAFLLTPAADTSAPVTTAALSPAPNAAGWNARDVTVTLTASDEDGGSGVRDITLRATGAQAIASQVVPGPQATVHVSAEGSTTLEYYASDNVGNPEAAKTLTVAIDRTAPTVSVQSPTAGPYLVAAAVRAAYSCVDTGSGVVSCSGPVPTGAPVDTASAGRKAFVTIAADAAGNAASTTVDYDVTYGIGVLYDPTKATKTVKVDLRDAAGVNVSSSSVALTARAIDGDAIVGGDFTFTRRTASYSYTVNTGGLSRGPHTLQFTAGSDPLVHSIPLQVR